MGLIFKSFIMSFGLTGRMILPSIGIVIVSALLTGVLNSFTGGFASVLSEPVTSAFITLFGIRVALTMMGNTNRTEYKILMLYAFLYGVAFFIASAVILIVSVGFAMLYASWQTGSGMTLYDVRNAMRSVEPNFAAFAISAKMLVFLTLTASVNALMAIPVANAARAAGSGAMGAGFFKGFGRSFIPLFSVFWIVMFLQFFFGILAFFFALAPLFMLTFTFLFTQSLPDIDLWFVVTGLAAGLGLLFLNCWTYAAAAVALGENSEAIAKKSAPPTPPRPTQMDIRSLRKSRET